MSNRYTIADENSRGMCDFYDHQTSEVLEGACVLGVLNEHENLLMKFQLMQAENERLENLNQAAYYWLLGIEKTIASDERGNHCCYFEADEVERLHAFIEVMSDKGGE